MNKIVILDDITANQIAAGEVVEGPASVVKEMVENAIDANASQVRVEIRGGGIKAIRVTDNGSGMEADDVALAFERHATSKIRTIADLDTIRSMGFRGEALASIASVSRLELLTRTADSQLGTKLIINAGEISAIEAAGCPKGSSFVVRDLFFNIPARYKFLKKDSTEAAKVADVMERLSLAHPDVSMQLINNSEIALRTPGTGALSDVILSLYGKEVAGAVYRVDGLHGGIRVSGYVGSPVIARGNRARQTIIMNHRVIRNSSISAALDEAYKTLLMTRQFALAVLMVELPAGRVDVNVHPSKLEVRFSEEGAVFEAVLTSVKNALYSASIAGEIAPYVTTSYEADLHKNERDKNILNNPRTLSTFFNETETNTITHFENDETQAESGEAHTESDERQAESLVYEAVETTALEFLFAPSANSSEDQVQYYGKPGERSQTLEGEQLSARGDETGYLHPALLQARIIGQLFRTFIVLELENEMLLLDQHAAHERIRFEALKRSLKNGETASQVLLRPAAVELSAIEYEAVFPYISALEKIGFELELFGNNTLLVRAIPSTFEDGLSEAGLASFIANWPLESSRRHGAMSDETLFMLACKGSIKANHDLSEKEILNVLIKLAMLENPYSCVHGRPIFLRFTRSEIEKRFRRTL